MPNQILKLAKFWERGLHSSLPQSPDTGGTTTLSPEMFVLLSPLQAVFFNSPVKGRNSEMGLGLPWYVQIAFFFFFYKAFPRYLHQNSPQNSVLKYLPLILRSFDVQMFHCGWVEGRREKRGCLEPRKLVLPGWAMTQLQPQHIRLEAWDTVPDEVE